MVHRGTTRESKRLREHRESSLFEKLKRHKNKKRIWRRAVKRLSQQAALQAA
jgi:hypothetical protein